MFDLNSIVSRNIKRLKDEKKLTYKQIGAFLGMRESSVRNMMTGRSRFNLIHIGKLSQALNCPVHLLFMSQSAEDMVGEPAGTDDYDKAFDKALSVPEVQMLVGEIGNLPKKMQKDIAQHLLDAVQLMTHKEK